MNWLARIIFARRSTLGHYLNIRTTVPDIPGELLQLIQPISDKGINILDLILSRGTNVPIDESMVELHLETTDVQQQTETKEDLRRRGYSVRD